VAQRAVVVEADPDRGRDALRPVDSFTTCSRFRTSVTPPTARAVASALSFTAWLSTVPWSVTLPCPVSTLTALRPAPSVVISAILIFVVIQVSSLACAEATPTPQIKRRATSVKVSFLLELITPPLQRAGARNLRANPVGAAIVGSGVWRPPEVSGAGDGDDQPGTSRSSRCCSTRRKRDDSRGRRSL
jgi:hypothetical protein